MAPDSAPVAWRIATRRNASCATCRCRGGVRLVRRVRARACRTPGVVGESLTGFQVLAVIRRPDRQVTCPRTARPPNATTIAENDVDQPGNDPGASEGGGRLLPPLGRGAAANTP